ncbi:hypothetical protein Peur_049805 [Populus x canadensis]
MAWEKQKQAAYAAKVREPVNLIATGFATKEFRCGNLLLPVVNVDPQFLATLETPWRQSVIMNLLGRSSAFKLLYTKIEQLWKPTAGFDVLDLGFDYFLVKFDEKEDFDNALGRGPKMILDHFRTTPAIQNHIESSAPCVGMSIQIPVVDPQLIQMAENTSGLYSSLVTKFEISIRDINLGDI